MVLSTTYSIKGTLSIDHIYDYLIVEEASQVDLATGVLAFSCARNIVIVGDLKQLPNVLTEEERQYAHDPLTHVDFLLFNQMDKQPVLAIEVDGTGFHEAGSKQAERDMKKNSILEQCAVPLLRLRTDGSGEKEKIRNALKRE